MKEYYVTLRTSYGRELEARKNKLTFKQALVRLAKNVVAFAFLGACGVLLVGYVMKLICFTGNCSMSQFTFFMNVATVFTQFVCGWQCVFATLFFTAMLATYAKNIHLRKAVECIPVFAKSYRRSAKREKLVACVCRFLMKAIFSPIKGFGKLIAWAFKIKP